jgi:ATP-binding cassette subfamily B protein
LKLRSQWRGRRLVVPEVVQTSEMDCGPASLKCLLEGFGLSISYGRLREACQTDVDGTSIDTMEDVAKQLGLDAEQVMLPVDHLAIPEAGALPAIAVVRLGGYGLTHFVVVWRIHGPFVQIMDPALGRRWPVVSRLLDDVYVHETEVPAAGWREWSESDEFRRTAERRLADLGVGRSERKRAVEDSFSRPTWRPPAALDATTRLVSTVVGAGGLRRGREATRALRSLLERARETGPELGGAVPPPFWSVRPAPPAEGGEERLVLRGAVLVRANGWREGGPKTKVKAAEEDAAAAAPPLPRELVAALEEPPSHPGRDLLRIIREDGLLAPSVLGGALAVAGLGVVLESVLFRGVLDLSQQLGLVRQRIGALGIIVALVVALLVLELEIAKGLLRLGRRLETRLRLAFLDKIPRLADQYFRSRLISDMAERSHTVHSLRSLPLLAGDLLRSTFALAFTTAGIAWLDPLSAPLAIAIAAIAVALPLAIQPLLAEREMRARSHAATLHRCYFDALMGLIPLRSHRAARAVRREHESFLTDWVRALLSLQNAVVSTEALQAAIGVGLAAWLVIDYVGRGGEAGVLLICYWALQLTQLGEDIARVARQYPYQRSITLRLFEPLGALEDENAVATGGAPSAPAEKRSGGVAVSFRGVTMRASGQTILDGVDLEIPAGSHVAIVGVSGAGKSSLIGLLLGFGRPTSGEVLADGVAVRGKAIEELRRETAWVDPAVQLWNRSFLENLRYGAVNPPRPIRTVIDAADLWSLLANLPEGMQTPLGEGGALVSGGEGQRVRLGRAMLRDGVRLAILDEPFRGLDRSRRHTLLERTREIWRAATLVCVTHDVGETSAFDRVLVVEGGRVVEDGHPASLSAQPGSRYRRMLDAEDDVRHRLWSAKEWHRMRLEEGRLASVEEPTP